MNRKKETLPFASSLFGVDTLSAIKREKKGEVLSTFVRCLPYQGVLLEYFCGDGKNFFSILSNELEKNGVSYIGVEPSSQLLSSFKEKLALRKPLEMILNQCNLLTEDEVCDLNLRVDGAVVSRGELHLLTPINQRALLLHLGSVSDHLLLHCVLSKLESSWCTYYHRGGESDEAYSIAPLSFYREVADTLHRKVTIIEVPEESPSELYLDAYLLFT